MRFLKPVLFAAIIVSMFYVYKVYSRSNDSSLDNKLLEKKSKSRLYFFEKDYNFGDVHSGDSVRHEFKFKNVGLEDLKIIDVSSSCGCTIPTWPNKLIKPNEQASIVVNFYKKDDLGMHKRLVIVKTNSIPEYSTLKIAANVVK